MAEVIKSIKSSGGDYATLASWEAAIPADQAVGDPWVAEFQEAFDGGPVTINVSNANSAPHKITAASAYRFTAGASWPAMAAISEGARIVAAAGSYGMTVSTPACVLEYIGIAADFDTTTSWLSLSASMTIRHCIASVMRYAMTITGSGDVLIHNVMILMSQSTLFNSHTISSNTSGTTSVYNCTVYNSRRWAYQRVGGTMNCYNCIGVSSTTADYTGTIGGDYNLSSDTSAPGTTVWTSVAASTILENVTGGSEDLHLKSSVDGTYEGGDYSGTIGSLDIDGDTRSDWDIGADEIAAAGGAAAFPFHRYYGGLI